MSTQMYAQLGDVVFGLTGPIVSLGTQHGYTYVEHAVIEGKPRLQSIGDALQRVSIDLVFVHPLTDPVAGIRALRSAAEAHQALPLVLAGGELRGRFVIESLEEGFKATDREGVPVHLEARLQLIEWVEPPASTAGTAAGTLQRNQAAPTATRAQQRGRARRSAAPPTPTPRPQPRTVPPSQVVRRDKPHPSAI